jgi:hypothetical protein
VVLTAQLIDTHLSPQSRLTSLILSLMLYQQDARGMGLYIFAGSCKYHHIQHKQASLGCCQEYLPGGESHYCPAQVHMQLHYIQLHSAAFWQAAAGALLLHIGYNAFNGNKHLRQLTDTGLPYQALRAIMWRCSAAAFCGGACLLVAPAALKEAVAAGLLAISLPL